MFHRSLYITSVFLCVAVHQPALWGSGICGTLSAFDERMAHMAERWTDRYTNE